MSAKPEPAIATALWYTGPGRAELRRAALPAASPGAARIRCLFSGISRGTESLIFSGAVPPAEYERMRGPHMDGAFPFPVKYGYAAVGEVEAGPPELIGQTVFALHPHQDRFVLPVEALAAVPANVPPRRAVLAANMETALNALWDAAAGPAMRIAVVGGGVLGLLTAYLAARLPGAEVTLVDLRPDRAKQAAALGFAFALPAAAPGDCDLVFHASASAAGLATAIGAAGMEARVIEMSWYGARDVPTQLGGAFHSRRLQLVSTQVGQVALAQRSRWSHRRRLLAALALLADPALDCLLEPDCPFDELPARLPALLGEAATLCQVIRYP